MLRLALLVLYLIASPFHSPRPQPYGLNAPPPAPTKQIGGGLDPDGLQAQTPPEPADIGGGWEPNG